MNNTIQLYIDKEKEIKGYPITSPDRVIDENGISIYEHLDTEANKKLDRNYYDNINKNMVCLNRKLKRDRYGFYSYNFIGDSISEGYDSTDHLKNSYVSLIRNSLNSYFDSSNLGFVNVHDTGFYHGITTWGTWTNEQDYEYLGNQVLKTSMLYASVTFKPKFTNQGYFRLCYEQNTNYSIIEVLVDDVHVGTINCNGGIDKCCCSGEFKCGNKIELRNVSNQPVAISGIWYYNSTDRIMVNNYSRAGMALMNTPAHILDAMCHANVVFMSLNHNDGFDRVGEYRTKINYIRDTIKSNNAFLYLLDFRWRDNAEHLIKKEIRRVFEELISEGYPVEFSDIGKDLANNDIDLLKNLGFFLDDESHPSDFGMKLIAYDILNHLHIPPKFVIETSDDSKWKNVTKFKNGWINTFKEYPTRYRKINGMIQIDFFVKDGTLEQPAFTLPVGYRPRTTTRAVVMVGERESKIEFTTVEFTMDGDFIIRSNYSSSYYGNVTFFI